MKTHSNWRDNYYLPKLQTANEMRVLTYTIPFGQAHKNVVKMILDQIEHLIKQDQEGMDEFGMYYVILGKHIPVPEMLERPIDISEDASNVVKTLRELGYFVECNNKEIVERISW